MAEYGIEAVKKQFIEMRQHQIESMFYHCDKLTPIEGIVLLTLFELSQYFGMNVMKYMHQVKVDKYTLDFLIQYEPLEGTEVTKKIIIECDGHDYHERTKEQAAHDKNRDRYFTKLGYTVLRYTGSEIVKDRFRVYRDVEELLLPEHRKKEYGYGEEFEKEIAQMIKEIKAGDY